MKIPDDTPVELSMGIWRLFGVGELSDRSRPELPLDAAGMELLRRHRERSLRSAAQFPRTSSRGFALEAPDRSSSSSSARCGGGNRERTAPAFSRTPSVLYPQLPRVLACSR